MRDKKTDDKNNFKINLKSLKLAINFSLITVF